MIVLAIPTIEERGDLWQETAKAWRFHTPEPLEIVPSWRKGSWAAGLNEVWERYPDAEIFICGSDDIVPENDGWLPVVEQSLAANESPAPLMHDPRFTIYGGSQAEVKDGHQTHMTNFPVLKKDWLPSVFPLPENLHYFTDNLIADRLHAIGVPTVARLQFVVRHTWDERGRGAGMGDESTRMLHDRKIYRALLS